MRSIRQFYLIIAFVVSVWIQSVKNAPVDPKKPTAKPNDVNTQDSTNDDYKEMGIEYNRYLNEVVQLLESDADFRQKLEKSDPEDIRSGKVAKELEYVNHHIRNKLDELKRQELERLRHLAIQEHKVDNGLNIPHNGKFLNPGHIDHRSPSFEAEDLRKLIVQTTKDLEEADKKRKEAFKEYEMQKEFEHQYKLKDLDEEKKKEEEKAWEEAQKRHKQHPKLHHPGSKQQFEEVWEEQDHLSPDSFNPKTFFALHDLDGNGYWDTDEVKALFTKELDKAYDPNAPEDDMAERYEEMERMREHVFNETDTNRDYLISFSEFLEQTRKQEFEQDPGWNTIDEQPAYTHEEYLEFERRRQMEIQRLIDQGLLPPQMPHPNAMPVHPNAVPYGMQPQPIPGQYAPYQPNVQPAVGQPAVGQPAVGQPAKQLTPEEAAKLQQQYQAYGQPIQYVPQQQFVQPGQQPVYGQPVYQPMQQLNYQQPIQAQGYPEVPVQQPMLMAQPINQQQPAQVQQQKPVQAQHQIQQPTVQQNVQQQQPVLSQEKAS